MSFEAAVQIRDSSVHGVENRPAPQKLRSELRSVALITAFLSLINVACFFRSLHGYFLADDFVHISFLWKVFHGHPELLLNNFFTNWMQAEGTQFYRPLVSLSLALDYSIWGANPSGFHLTNLLLQIGCTILLFLLTRLLFPFGSQKERILLAAAAGGLFAVYPLHPEVVSWVIARVDSLCTLFYLAAFWLFLEARQRTTKRAGNILTVSSLVTFVLALLSKEMAVTLPAVLSAYCLLLSSSDPSSRRSRLKDAAFRSLPYWLILVGYIAVRTAALGTWSGGYGGSIGAGLAGSILERICNKGSISHVVFPMSDALFPPGNKVIGELGTLYIGTLLLSSGRIFLLAKQKQLQGWFQQFGFALLWFLLVMLPTLPVWDLTDNLQGSRFIYLGTAPLTLLIAFLYLPLSGQPLRKDDKSKGDFASSPEVIEGTDTALTKSFAAFSLSAVARWAGILLFLALFSAYGLITYRNNLAWVHASHQLKHLKGSLEQLLDRLPQNEKIAILNIPHRCEGAHVLYNGTTFGVMLQPPLSRTDQSERVLTFEPITYGEPDLIEVSRLRAIADEQSSPVSFYRWNCEKERLDQIPELRTAHNFRILSGLPDSDSADATRSGLPITLDPVTKTHPAPQAIESPLLAIPAIDADFVDVQWQTAAQEKAPASATSSPVLVLAWAGPDGVFEPNQQLAIPIDPHTGMQVCNTARFFVSEHKSWLGCGRIQALRLQSVACPLPISISSVSVLAGTHEIAQLSPSKSKNSSGRRMIPDVCGICHPGAKTLGRFDYDVTAIPGATAAIYELSQPDSWFEHYSGHFRDDHLATKVLARGDLPACSGRDFELHLKERIKVAGFYELRIGGINANGKIIGYLSDPLNIQISPEELKAQ